MSHKIRYLATLLVLFSLFLAPLVSVSAHGSSPAMGNTTSAVPVKSQFDISASHECESNTPGKAEQCNLDKQARVMVSQTVSGTPLSFVVYDDTSTAMYYNGIQQFYGGNAEGVFIWVNGTVYGPGLVPAGNSTNAYYPVSNSTTGTGSAANPWKAITVVDVGYTGLRIQQEIKYINGESKVTYSWRVSNTSGTAISYTLFHAADLYTSDDDYGYGYYGASTGSIGGYTQSRSFYQYFQPITAGSKYFEGFYGDTWNRIGSTYSQGAGFDNSYRPNDYIDNSAGLQWDRTVATGGVDLVSDYGVFNTNVVTVNCYSLSITPPSGGSIQVMTSPSLTCTNNRYTEGTTVWLKAVPNGQNEVSSWSGVDYAMSNYARVDMNSNKTVGISFRKPVIVLVHGILTVANWTDTCQSSAYHYSASPTSTSGVDKQLREYFSTLPSALNANYDVWIAHVASGFWGTPSLNDNAACLSNQIKDISNTVHPNSIRLIAHSMGGLVSRGCISQNLNGCQGLVDSLMTLGSPHAGTHWPALPGQTALSDMSASSMVKFNNANPNVLAIDDYTFLGGGWDPTFIVGVGTILGDTVVSDVSAIGWTNSQGTTNPSYWDRGFCDPNYASCPIQPSRIWTHNTHSNYFESTSEAMQCITWFLEGGSRPLACANVWTYKPQPASSSTNNFQTTPLIEENLPAGYTTNYTVLVDTTNAASFVLLWSGGNPSITLTQPGGLTIDPTYAVNYPGVVTYNDISGGGTNFNQRVYTFGNVVSGTWQVHVSNVGSASSHYFLQAQLETSRVLTVTTNASTLVPGQLLTVNANLNNGTIGITGATLYATLARSDGNTDMIALTSQGNGNYAGSYVAPNVPGYLTLTVGAAGYDGLVPFERQVSQTLGISPQSANFNNVYSDMTPDGDGNGLYDSLDIQVGINVATPGKFGLTGDLTSSGQFVAHAGIQATLGSGSQSLTLSFSGDSIRASGLNGPYTLTNLVLTNPALGSIPIASASNAWSSNAYSALEFGASCFTLDLGFNPSTGGTLVPQDPPNCGGTKYAAGSVVTVTALANTGHTFSNWSGDASGTDSTTSVTMNQDKLLVANFALQCYALNLNSNPNGAGSIQTDSAPDCSGNLQYSYGAVIQLSAQGASGYGFVDWGGDVSGMNNPILVTMTGDKTITANFRMVTFTDVPSSFWAWLYVERLYAAGVTGGCSLSPLMYCPGVSVNRAQMAVFLLRGEHGNSYTPPAATGTVFGDVPADHWAAAWIEQLYTEGITGGCGGGNYCPETPVTRDQMAVFLLRAEHGADYTPPSPTGVFTDVPTNHWAAAWIEQLAAEGITGGCGGGNYCPATVVNRDQMAVFLVRTFSLP